MTQDFIEEKGLEFVAAPDIGDFWGGVDECGEHSFELFITASEAGPTSVQVEQYRSLCANFGSVYSSIRERYLAHLAAMDAGKRGKWQNVPIRVIFVNVYDDHRNGDVELTCMASRRHFIFTRRLNFLATVRDNRVVSLEAR
jgi:hypothetical protein